LIIIFLILFFNFIRKINLFESIIYSLFIILWSKYKSVKFIIC
jgi:hypothetical protein